MAGRGKAKDKAAEEATAPAPDEVDAAVDPEKVQEVAEAAAAEVAALAAEAGVEEAVEVVVHETAPSGDETETVAYPPVVAWDDGEYRYIASAAPDGVDASEATDIEHALAASFPGATLRRPVGDVDANFRPTETES